jgi:hypothetical protein
LVILSLSALILAAALPDRISVPNAGMRDTGARVVAIAHVEIIRAEVINTIPPKRALFKSDRQFRRRDRVPLVEFF